MSPRAFRRRAQPISSNVENRSLLTGNILPLSYFDSWNDACFSFRCLASSDKSPLSRFENHSSDVPGEEFEKLLPID
jgi:hypothetical protein